MYHTGNRGFGFGTNRQTVAAVTHGNHSILQIAAGGCVVHKTSQLCVNAVVHPPYGFTDFIFAKAELAKSYNGVATVFNEEGRINIRKGRHPLLDPKKVVPIDVRLGADFRQLFVTGPNTGGKTVSLKTVP